MRIAIDGTILTRSLTGVGIYTLRLVQELARLPETEIFVMAQDELECGFDAKNVQVIIEPAMNFHFFIQRRIPGLIEKYNIDVLHGPNFYLPIKKNAPAVLTVHDLSAQLFPKQHSIKHRISQKMLGPSLKRADRIIAVSRSTAEDLAQLFPSTTSKIEVVYNGLEKRFTPCSRSETDEILARYNLPERFILFVGTLEPRKNIRRLICAFSQITERFPTIKLIVAGGKGWLFDDIFELVRKKGLRDRIQFIGYVENEDLPALYSAAEVFCYPSLYEGFGLPPLEAAACGTPVVTSNISSMPEVMDDAALFVDPLDIDSIYEAILTILEDKNLAASLTKKGLNRAKEFSWEETAIKTLAIYRSLL